MVGALFGGRHADLVEPVRRHVGPRPPIHGGSYPEIPEHLRHLERPEADPQFEVRGKIHVLGFAVPESDSEDVVPEVFGRSY